MRHFIPTGFASLALVAALYPASLPAQLKPAPKVDSSGFSPLTDMGKENRADLVLFDFEDAADLKHWSNLALDRPEGDRSPAYGAKDHPIKFKLAKEGATSGENSLKLTFSGGEFPAITTNRLPVEDLSAYKSFRADVTASRTCVVIFRAVFQDGGRSSMNPTTRWEKAALVHAGKNEVVDAFAEVIADKAVRSKAVAFEIGMYHPRDGETIHVDNIRLSKDPAPHATPFRERNFTTPGQPIPLFPKLDKKFKVLGADWEVTDPVELADRVKDKWVKPEKEQTVAEVEAKFQAVYDELKKQHPKAVLARFRDGDTGFAPKDTAKKYEGWTDCYLSGHDPGSVYLNQVARPQVGKNTSYEVFLWRRCPVMRVDLTSIPKGATVLAARFVLTRAQPPAPAKPRPGNPVVSPFKPTLFVAHPCNRPWKETEANAFEYAKDQFWKEICGMDLNGDDPDVSPVILAYGQSKLMVSDWDFTEAVRYWTDGKHDNHGFLFYSLESRPRNYMDFFVANSRECPEVQKRPCLLVVYVPKD